MLKFLIFFAICFIFSNVSAHPDRLVKKKINWNEGDNLPVILSYHIHCVFVNADSSIVQKAANLYKDFQIQFNLTSSPLCNSTFDEKRICMFDFAIWPEMDSPFISGNWAVFLPPSWFSPMVQWIHQHRGDLDILIHPNSGAELSDHTLWALWGGRTWPLNTSAFSNQTFV